MTRYFRKVIRIVAEDSPNVQLGLLQLARGEEPTDEVLVPGVLTYSEWRRRLATWDEVRKTVGLWAQFYKGAAIMLFPAERLDRAAERFRELRGRRRMVRGIGIDPGEGNANTTWVLMDELGVIDIESEKTADTSVVVPRTMALIRRTGISPTRVCFDRGGGGKQHADMLRARGFPVRTVGFGAKARTEVKHPGQVTLYREKRSVIEEKTTFKNMRCQMFFEVSDELNPANNLRGFAVPGPEYGPAAVELRRQLLVFERCYDENGVSYTNTKKPPALGSGKTPPGRPRSLLEVLGGSPDEADAFALARYAMMHQAVQQQAGVV